MKGLDGDTRLIAVVTAQREFVAGGVPVFVEDDEERRKQLAAYLAKISMGMVHDLEGGTYVIARH